MTKIPSIHKQVSKVIEEVKATKNWQLLDSIKAFKGIEQLSHVEKEKLSHLFLERGEELIEKYEKIKDLEEAFSAFEMALKCDPACGKAWIALAQTHLKMGLLNEDEKLVNKAKDLFEQAEVVYRSQQQKIPVEVLWDWGICVYSLAKISEEAVDFKQALDKFTEAHQRGLYNADFLLDYGTTMGELGVLVGQEELIKEATEILEDSLEENGENGTTWLRLACAYKILYFITGDVGYYEKGDQSFFGAARLDDNHVALWLNWGQLVLLEGKTVRNDELLKIALDKLDKADSLKPNDPIIMAAWADAKMHLGVLEDKYDYLKEACDKLKQCLEKDPNQNDIICLMGHCLTYIGKYFNEASYVEEAIEKFQVGISREKTAYNLWHGLANAHFILGEFSQDVKEYEKAAKFCEQTIRLGGNSPNFWNDWGVAFMRIAEQSQDPNHLYEAIAKFEEAISSYNQRARGQPDPDWFYNYGCALDSLGDLEGNPHFYERSIAILTKLLEQYPELHHARYNLALAYYHLGDAVEDPEIIEKAIEHFRFLIQNEPEEDGLYNDLGLCLLTLADLASDSIYSDRAENYFKQSEAIFFQALALGGEVGNFYLACQYSLQENYTEAMHFMERAKQAGALPTLDDLMQDEWLDGLRQTPRFRAFLSSLSEEN